MEPISPAMKLIRDPSFQRGIRKQFQEEARWRRILGQIGGEYLNALYWGLGYLAIHHSPFLPSDLWTVLHLPKPPEGTTWRIVQTPLGELEKLAFIELSGTRRKCPLSRGQRQPEWQVVRALQPELATYIREHCGPRPSFLPPRQAGRS